MQISVDKKKYIAVTYTVMLVDFSRRGGNQEQNRHSRGPEFSLRTSSHLSKQFRKICSSIRLCFPLHINERAERITNASIQTSDGLLLSYLTSAFAIPSLTETSVFNMLKMKNQNFFECKYVYKQPDWYTNFNHAHCLATESKTKHIVRKNA